MKSAQPHDEWVYAFLDGELSEQQAAVVEAWIVSAPENADYVASLAILMHGIGEEFKRDEISNIWQELSDLEPDAEHIQLVDITNRVDEKKKLAPAPAPAMDADRRGKKVIVIPRSVAWLTAAAILLFGLWVAVPRIDEDPGSGADDSQITQAPRLEVQEMPVVALLEGAFNVRWGQAGDTGTGDTELEAGSEIRAGQRLVLERGVAQIQSHRGAVVVLEGPCEIAFVDEHRVRLAYGRIVGKCPTSDSKGFTVDTPSATIVDLGTEFGVHTTSEGLTEVHVMTGKVSLAPRTADNEASEVELGAGRGGIVTSGSSQIVEIESTPAQFVSSLEDASSNAMQQYVSSVTSLNPLVYYRFESLAGGVAINEMGSKYFGFADGAVSTVRIGSVGNAASFSSDQAGHIRVDQTISELRNAEAYTIECWAKPNNALAIYGSLVSMTTPEREALAASGLVLHGLSEEAGAERGLLRFYHRNPPSSETGTEVYSQRRWAVDQWMHIAAVKDRTSAKLYINGELVAVLDDTTAFPDTEFVTKIGIHQTQPEARQKRPYEGLIDEVAIYDRALTVNDIESHYNKMRYLLNEDSSRPIGD